MQDMRKLIAYLLIALISLQAAFAAAGSACLHERDAAARHFGHHAHQHRAPTAEPAPVDVKAADYANPDHDCTSCHANSLAGVPARLQLLALPAAVALTVEAAPFHPSSPPPWRPERPNWSWASTV